MSKKAHGNSTQAVLDSLESPARTIRQLQAKLAEAEKALAEANRERDAALDGHERAQRTIAQLRGELYRAGPVAADDERILAERMATVSYRRKPGAGKPQVALTMLRAKPSIGESLLDALDKALHRTPIRRGQ